MRSQETIHIIHPDEQGYLYSKKLELEVDENGDLVGHYTKKFRATEQGKYADDEPVEIAKKANKDDIKNHLNDFPLEDEKVNPSIIRIGDRDFNTGNEDDRNDLEDYINS